MPNLADLVQRELRLDLLTAPQLCQRLGISQPTLSRAVGKISSVVKVGRARRVRYALLRGAVVQVNRIDQNGALHAAEHQLLPVYPHGYVLTHIERVAFPLSDDMQDGYFESLPYFLYAARPQGFLGRLYAKHASARLGISSNPVHWQDDDIVRSLQDLAGAAAGAYLLGDAFGAPPPLNDDYPALAEQALQGDIAGSSAGGEFPKFVTRTVQGDVIVKFSAPDDSPPARRWKDLLIAESCFAAVAPLLGVVAATSRILHAGGRVFLETQRFDHLPTGRITHCALGDLAPALTGQTGGRWDNVTAAFVTHGWLDADTQHAIRRLSIFGALIGNTDMHHGNLSFYATVRPELVEARTLQLSPIYDMLPMGYAPRTNGEIPRYQIDLQNHLPDDDFYQARAAARRYWQHAACHPEISSDFADIARGNVEKLAGG
ncbi:MAG: HipA domain-containing protein [Gallionella sp.]